MKITLGESWINYLYSGEDALRETILSEVVESNLFPLSPIYVNKVEELEALFGKNFLEYDYLVDLLNTGKISLFLMGPRYTEFKKIVDEKYYFLPDVSPQTAETISVLSDTESLISDENTLPKIGNPERLYKVLTFRGPYFDAEKKVYFSYYQYIDSINSYAECSAEEIKRDISAEEVDLLSIGENGIYCYPPAFTQDFNLPREYVPYPKEFNIDNIQSKIERGILGKNLSIDIVDLKLEDFDSSNIFTKTIDSVEYTGTYYFALPKFTRITEDPEEGEKIVTEYDYYYYIPSNIYIQNPYPANESFTDLEVPLPGSTSHRFSTIEELKSLLNSNTSLTQNEDGVYKLELPELQMISYPLCMPNTFYYSSSFFDNQNYLYETYVKPCELYRFSSKTLGTEGPESDITINIEKSPIEDYFYITVLRYNYEETFEGPLVGRPGEERLDHFITRESKLINFEILVDDTPENGWIIGNWSLRSDGLLDLLSNADFGYSLKKLSESSQITDFFLIPDKNKFSDLEILRATEACNCQALVVNTTPNIKSNLVDEDPDNRLIYFFGDFLFSNDTWKPGYDVFIKGLLNNNYLPSIKHVIYPVGYLEEWPEDLDFEEYKSNFLTYNEYFYYYDRYFSGENYNTTALVRFVISKVSRSLERYKWDILGSKMDSDHIIRSKFEKILWDIQKTYTIIRSIEVEKFFVNRPYQKLQANILTKMSDLISEDVSFDIILNYNKNQT